MDMNMKQNKIYGFLQKWIPVLILLLYPLRKVNTGIDLMDDLKLFGDIPQSNQMSLFDFTG